MISIIIPTLNEGKIIQETLVSLKKGLSLPHEIIVSDGNSTDGTIEIAKQYADQVVVYTSPERQTIAGGRNAGAKLAQGDILIFLDADCTLANPDFFFKTVIDQFEKDPKLTALTGWLEVLPGHATLADKVISYIVSFVYMVCNNVLGIGASFGELQIIRQSAFEKLGGYDERLVAGEDVDMFKRLSKLGTTYLDSTLVVYHTGRRAHKIGWVRLLSQWFLNFIWITFSKRAKSKEWTVIR